MGWEDYLNDLDIFLQQAAAWHGAPVPILFGHSMGGLMAVSYLLERDHHFRSLVLSSPFFAVGAKVPWIKLAAVRLLSKIAPKVSLPTEIDPAVLSHDQTVCRKYRDDPLVFKVINARWVTESMKAQANCLAQAQRLAVENLLLVYGTDDKLAAPQGAQAFFDAVELEDRTCIPYQGLYHELFNEADKQRPYADLRDWLAKRI
jgi:alpha-beta hydrolase superfamily lysophospholipase